MWNLANTAFIKGKICSIKCLLLNEENSQIYDFSLNKLRKEQQIKPKERRQDLIALLQKLYQAIEKEGAFPTHSTSQLYPVTKARQTHYKKRQLQTNISCEHRYDISKQNVTKLNSAICLKDNNTSGPSGVYPRKARLLSCMKINYWMYLNILTNLYGHFTNLYVTSTTLHHHFSKHRKNIW